MHICRPSFFYVLSVLQLLFQDRSTLNRHTMQTCVSNRFAKVIRTRYFCITIITEAIHPFYAAISYYIYLFFSIRMVISKELRYTAIKFNECNFENRVLRVIYIYMKEFEVSCLELIMNGL
jgi:hypothetical protein